MNYYIKVDITRYMVDSRSSHPTHLQLHNYHQHSTTIKLIILPYHNYTQY